LIFWKPDIFLVWESVAGVKAERLELLLYLRKIEEVEARATGRDEREEREREMAVREQFMTKEQKGGGGGGEERFSLGWLACLGWRGRSRTQARVGKGEREGAVEGRTSGIE
jgi:hypothetical protein